MDLELPSTLLHLRATCRYTEQTTRKLFLQIYFQAVCLTFDPIKLKQLRRIVEKPDAARTIKNIRVHCNSDFEVLQAAKVSPFAPEAFAFFYFPYVSRVLEKLANIVEVTFYIGREEREALRAVYTREHAVRLRSEVHISPAKFDYNLAPRLILSILRGSTQRLKAITVEGGDIKLPKAWPQHYLKHRAQRTSDFADTTYWIPADYYLSGTREIEIGFITAEASPPSTGIYAVDGLAESLAAPGQLRLHARTSAVDSPLQYAALLSEQLALTDIHISFALCWLPHLEACIEQCQNTLRRLTVLRSDVRHWTSSKLQASFKRLLQVLAESSYLEELNLGYLYDRHLTLGFPGVARPRRSKEIENEYVWISKPSLYQVHLEGTTEVREGISAILSNVTYLCYIPPVEEVYVEAVT